MEEIIHLDQELFLFLNNLGSPAWDDFWNVVTNKWASIPFYIVLVYLLFRSLGWQTAVVTLVLVAGMITATDQLANVLKDGFQRLRPCRQEGVMEYARFVAVRCGKYGYFSAHAASSAAVVVYIGSILRPYYSKILLILIVWAVMVAYSRIYIGVHYPLDMLTGFAIGGSIGYIFYRIQQAILKRFTSINPEQETTS